jgi:hypothetical protein
MPHHASSSMTTAQSAGPTRGPVERDRVCWRPNLLKVFSLPWRHTGEVHWQEVAMVAISRADREGARPMVAPPGVFALGLPGRVGMPIRTAGT